MEEMEEAFERGETERLSVLLRDLRLSRLPPIPDAARRLLVIQGLERAERCVQAGYLALARTELGRAVERVEEARPPGGAGACSRAVTPDEGSLGDAPLLEMDRC